MDDDLRALHNNSDPDTLARLRETYDREFSIVAIKDAYLCMAEYAHYRPEAPTDGFGNIPFDLDSTIRSGWRSKHGVLACGGSKKTMNKCSPLTAAKLWQLIQRLLPQLRMNRHQVAVTMSGRDIVVKSSFKV